MAFIDRIATLGKGGLGAVMGAKNLKAITVRGSRGVRVADRRDTNLESSAFEDDARVPLPQGVAGSGAGQILPHDSQRDLRGHEEEAHLLCLLSHRLQGPGRDSGRGPPGFTKHSSSVINLYTPVLYGFEDYRESIKCMATIDSYGLDMFEFFGMMRFAKALSDQGMISRDLLDTEITLDSLDSMETWARKISYREGLGDILADGFERVVTEFGERRRAPGTCAHQGNAPLRGPRIRARLGPVRNHGAGPGLGSERSSCRLGRLPHLFRQETAGGLSPPLGANGGAPGGHRPHPAGLRLARPAGAQRGKAPGTPTPGSRSSDHSGSAPELQSTDSTSAHCVQSSTRRSPASRPISPSSDTGSTASGPCCEWPT